MADQDLFEPNDLFEVKDFGKVSLCQVFYLQCHKIFSVCSFVFGNCVSKQVKLDKSIAVFMDVLQ